MVIIYRIYWLISILSALYFAYKGMFLEMMISNAFMLISNIGAQLESNNKIR